MQLHLQFYMNVTMQNKSFLNKAATNQVSRILQSIN